MQKSDCLRYFWKDYSYVFPQPCLMIVICAYISGIIVICKTSLCIGRSLNVAGFFLLNWSHSCVSIWHFLKRSSNFGLALTKSYSLQEMSWVNLCLSLFLRVSVDTKAVLWLPQWCTIHLGFTSRILLFIIFTLLMSAPSTPKLSMFWSESSVSTSESTGKNVQFDLLIF